MYPGTPQEHLDVAGLSLRLVGVAFALALLLFVGLSVMMRAHRHRLAREHAERLRMREAGLPVLSTAGSEWPRAAVCVAIGAGVPLLSFYFTWLAYSAHRNAADALWVGPAFISAVSVLSASLLAGFLFSSGTGSTRGSDSAPSTAKPAIDRDAFELVEQRG